ncbi:hypothetical protein GOP47_0018953 [Adiantum capillus-veneris]|uniref:Epidermal patterning factor-like protein n=1 Tax=Adiantum capillus-veneris TaxID=13818 RepID=A0A9D4UFE8_ADICA|nr:hypothetical protein GOP47_0018953 [Adiantum capillus-veneris]
MQPKAAPNSCGKGFSSSSSTFPPKCHSSSVQQEKRILTRADDYHHDAVARREELVEAEYTKTVRTLRKRLGSRPPMCRDKCETCFPCEAVKMVPTPMIASTTASQHNMAHLDYSNYDPVGWKCKCGARIFNP